jgi:RNA polymerase sigma-70 factor (sigma-E family)
VQLGNRDDAAFAEFVRARTPALLRTAYLLTGDQGAAEDLVQAGLVKVAGRWARISACGDPEPYVRTVLYREHVSRWRHHRVDEVQLVDEELPTGGHDDQVAVALTLEAALAQLAPRQRAVVVLRYFDDLSETAAADALGCSVGTVRSQTFKAIARLRALAPELLEEVRS